MWHGLSKDMGEYQQNSLIVCNFDVKKDKVDAILAGRYSYEDMTDPDSKPKELCGKLTSEGNLELSLSVQLGEKTKMTVFTSAELKHKEVGHGLGHGLALPLGL